MISKLSTLLEQLRHACSVALGDLIALGMPERASTSKLLQQAITAAERQLSMAPSEQSPEKTDDSPRDNPPPIQAGDLLYAVGPGHHAPHSATDLQVYSAVVTSVRPEGSYSEHAPPELRARAVLMIELSDDRPILGFPKWVYRSYDVGINVHRSRTDALRAFNKRAHGRLHEASRAQNRANEEIQWALDEEWGLNATKCEENIP